jgi:hypothetical protein
MTESGTPAVEPAVDEHPAPEPNWWHRSHPTFAGIVGFFAGVAYVIILPGIFAAVLSLVVSDNDVQRLFPLVILILVVPLVMLVSRRTRRFAQFMLLGVASTAVVIGLTTALVLWILVKTQG